MSETDGEYSLAKDEAYWAIHNMAHLNLTACEWLKLDRIVNEARLKVGEWSYLRDPGDLLLRLSVLRAWAEMWRDVSAEDREQEAEDREQRRTNHDIHR